MKNQNALKSLKADKVNREKCSSFLQSNPSIVNFAEVFAASYQCKICFVASFYTLSYRPVATQRPRNEKWHNGLLCNIFANKQQYRNRC
jgi:hypothetical protein